MALRCTGLAVQRQWFYSLVCHWGTSFLCLSFPTCAIRMVMFLTCLGGGRVNSLTSGKGCAALMPSTAEATGYEIISCCLATLLGAWVCWVPTLLSKEALGCFA